MWIKRLALPYRRPRLFILKKWLSWSLQVSDMRRHTFRGALSRAKVVYLRGEVAGACGYFDDGRFSAAPHGLAWAQHAADLEVSSQRCSRGCTTGV